MHGKLKVLVTGGAGFIGSNICLRLLNKGHEVICLDNLSTGRKSNMMEFLFNPLFHFIVHDITTPFSISGIDLVVHCATPDLKDPLHFLKTCSYGAFTVAGIARRNNAKLVCLSSSKAYGRYSRNCSEKEGDISDPDTQSIGFNIMEEILKNYSKLDIKILRLFDVYGPKMREDSFIFSNLRSISRGWNIGLANPDSILCSCYVDDVVDAVCCSMEMDYKKTILNIGSSSEIFVKEIYNIAIKESASNSVIDYKNIDLGRLGDCANTACAGEVLKWAPKISYNTGIKKLLDFIRIGPDRDYEFQETSK